ncbi:head-tail connector protein [Stenotrophomonas sp.]|uniref:head-tail connector protein n=1 Tax=Stenotrophomonas sp. TaxID=69392 RepID=UPI0025DCD63B|nr:head-tail connector protein [Stenotrophomonas sp.]MBW8373621.1 phage gp6-like head-tail connector protein [Stenotrophomonas sp.]
MSIPTMMQAKSYLRLIDGDLDAVVILAISAAQAEMDAFIGGDTAALRWPADEDVPGDVTGAALLLLKLHFEESDPERAEQWRAIAQRLLFPYRVASGVKEA